MGIDLKQWTRDFGGAEAVKSIEEAKKNVYQEVPDGAYTCKLEKLELAESSTNKPMVKAMFRIVEGKYKKQCLFYNGVMAANDPSKSGFVIHNVLQFLRSLNVLDEADVDFNGDFEDFNDLLLDIAEESEELKFEIDKFKDGDYSRINCIDTYE